MDIQTISFFIKKVHLHNLDVEEYNDQLLCFLSLNSELKEVFQVPNYQNPIYLSVKLENNHLQLDFKNKDGRSFGSVNFQTQSFLNENEAIYKWFIYI